MKILLPCEENTYVEKGQSRYKTRKSERQKLAIILDNRTRWYSARGMRREAYDIGREHWYIQVIFEKSHLGGRGNQYDNFKLQEDAVELGKRTLGASACENITDEMTGEVIDRPSLFCSET